MPNSLSDSRMMTLTSEERALIQKALAGLKYEPQGGCKYIQNLRMLAYRSFPRRLLKKLEELKGNDASYFVFDNVPIDRIYGSPSDEGGCGSACKSGFLSENLLAAVGSVLAEPYSIQAEGASLVNDLVPRADTIFQYTGNGAEVELDLHIENASQVYDVRGDTAPLGLILLGLRNDPYVIGPKTWVADARNALALLSPEEIELLYGQHFVIRQPYRWRQSTKVFRESRLFPILSGPRSYPRVTAAFYPGMVTAVDEAAHSAYMKFYAELKTSCVPIDICPGRMVYINNRFTLHSRDKFSPSYDGNGQAYRWLQRLFVTNNIWNFRSFKSGDTRVFSDDKLS